MEEGTKGSNENDSTVKAILFTLLLFYPLGLTIFLDSNTIRCFHRTFICTKPSPDAESKGWPVTILNDALYIGGGKVNTIQSSANVALTPQQQVQAQAYATLAPQNMPPLTPNDQQMIATLSQQGGVDVNTAAQLLFQYQGNMSMAMEHISRARR